MSTDRNQNADIYQSNQAANTAEAKGLLASVGETLSHAKDQLVGAISKNEAAVKEEYHQNRAENADNLVDQAKHKGQEWQQGISKNVDAVKEEYHDAARQTNQDRAMEHAQNVEPKGLIQSAVDTISSVKDQVVSSISNTMESGKESYPSERMNDSSDIANKERGFDSRRENFAENDRSRMDDPQNKGYIQSAMDSLSHMKDEFVASFNKNSEAAKEEYYKQKSDQDSNVVDQAKDKAKEWGHGIQKNTEGVKEEFHSQPKGDENKGIQNAADKLSHMKDEAASSLNKNMEAAKEEYYSKKADNSSNLVDQVKNKGQEWQHGINKNVEAAKEEFHADA